MLAIVDSGGANIGSVAYALRRLGVEASLTANREEIRAADRVILPGVGAAGAAMEVLRGHDLIDFIPQLTQPVLGICLGMQLLFDGSDEDDVDCLGILPGRARLLTGNASNRIPHMGWNALETLRAHALVDDLPDQPYAYFVHSYAIPLNEASVCATTHVDSFAAVAAKRNFMAAQFHPERSAATGQQLLANFLRL